jgi:sec-independent protein translocase protein TatC
MALVPFPNQSKGRLSHAQEPDEPDFDELDDSAGAKMSFLEHLDELRKRLVTSAIALGVGFLISFAFIGRLFEFIMVPLQQMLPKGGTLIYTEPMEAFMLYLRVALLVGVILAAPVILWQFWLFVAPGLYAREKKFVIPFVVLGTIGFVTGALFSHYLLFPWTWKYLASFSTDYMTFAPRIEPVFSLYSKMLLGMGVVFQMPTVVLFLAKMGVVTGRFLVKKFKYAVLIIFVVAAIITPSADIGTQVLFALPMIGLYLISIVIAFIFGKRRRKPSEA